MTIFSSPSPIEPTAPLGDIELGSPSTHWNQIMNHVAAPYEDVPTLENFEPKDYVALSIDTELNETGDAETFVIVGDYDQAFVEHPNYESVQRIVLYTTGSGASVTQIKQHNAIERCLRDFFEEKPADSDRGENAIIRVNGCIASYRNEKGNGPDGELIVPNLSVTFVL